MFNIRIRPLLRSFLYLFFIFMSLQIAYLLIFKKQLSDITKGLIFLLAWIIALAAARLFNNFRLRKLIKKNKEEKI